MDCGKRISGAAVHRKPVECQRRRCGFRPPNGNRTICGRIQPSAEAIRCTISKPSALCPIRHAPRQVPAWAASDGHVRALLEAKYPRIHQPGTRDRRDGARMALLVYFAYRLLFSDETIAGELGIQRATVGFQLWRVKALGDKLFSGAWRIRGRNRSGHPMFERAA